MHYREIKTKKYKQDFEISCPECKDTRNTQQMI